MNHQLDQVIAGLQQQVGYLQQAVRNMQGTGAGNARDLQEARSRIEQLQGALGAVSSGGGGQSTDLPCPEKISEHSIRYIERIPGRRIPFDLLVDIPIGATQAATTQGTRTISQDGPFVAVMRYATFQSALQFQVTDPVTGAAATFQGRSFGRFRPVNSVGDLNDAAAGVFNPVVGMAFPGTGAPIFASPSNMSSFRSMEWDGAIEMLNQGSGYPRSNQEVPSAFYMSELNSAFQLGALDFFERGETIQWKVRPTHLNNPSAGNVAGFGAGGLYPFLASQYDVQEGISDPINPNATTDPVVRLPDGILIVGMHGIKIIQPPGPVRIT